jgi:UDP:flavonoid glycosyltransferase YjiC (YdhE family)
MRRTRVLIMAEAVTLAHVGRPAALAAALDPQRFEVHFATSPRFDALLGPLPHRRHPLDTIPTERFLAALDRGTPIYTKSDLRDYVREDRALLAEIHPDVVVGDFRLSLSISARLANVPYATITNIYWSPLARQRFPLPELPLTRALGVRAAGLIFPAARPVAFALHTRPLNHVRREHGLPSLGPDLRRTYTDADHVLFADAPELAPPHTLAPGHEFLGPVVWEPAALPPELPAGPLVYVTLGSSGRSRLLPAVVRALADLPVTVVVASAGADLPDPLPPNVIAADYLPGTAVTRRAALVVCNGGSPSVQQALSAGTPVLGLPGNMDQHLSMRSVIAAGVGLLVRSEHATPTAIARAARQLLAEPPLVDGRPELHEPPTLHESGQPDSLTGPPRPDQPHSPAGPRWPHQPRSPHGPRLLDAPRTLDEPPGPAEPRSLAEHRSPTEPSTLDAPRKLPDEHEREPGHRPTDAPPSALAAHAIHTATNESRTLLPGPARKSHSCGSNFRTRAQDMADRLAAYDAPATFARAVERLSRQ